jgi:hypothetical protein
MPVTVARACGWVSLLENIASGAKPGAVNIRRFSLTKNAELTSKRSVPIGRPGPDVNGAKKICRAVG